jgi:hypothetical protein
MDGFDLRRMKTQKPEGLQVEFVDGGGKERTSIAIIDH